MATLLSAATGNFTASGSWGLASSTAELDSETGTTNVSTSNLDSSAFQPGAVTVDGVALKINSLTTPTGTFTVTLRNSTAGVDVASVTVNASDLLNPGSSVPSGWHFFKFGSTQLLIAATNYVIRVVRSVADSAGSNRIQLFRDGTTNNHSRQLRSTTNQAPASGDKLIIIGELTGAGTGNDITVTMDQTANTSYGSVSFLQSISINRRGILTFGTAASTNYVLKFAGIMAVYIGGTLNTGTTGTPMPASSTATIQFDVASNVDTGLWIRGGGVWNGRGNALSFVKTLLSANASAAATSLTTADSTGWKNGDNLCLASTTRTNSDCETKALTADASGTTLTIAALTSAHSGTSPTQAEVGNLTRNVKILGTSTSLQGYVYLETSATIDVQYHEFKNLGSITVLRRGIDCAITTGTCNFQYNSIWDGAVSSSLAWNQGTTTANNITFSNNVVYNCIGSGPVSITANTTGTNNVYDGNLIIHLQNTPAFSIADVGGTITNNTVVGGNIGFAISSDVGAIGTFSGNTGHSAQGSNFSFVNAIGGTVSNVTSWRSNFTNGGIQIGNATSGLFGVTFDGITSFGNLTDDIIFGICGNITLNNATLNGDTTFSTASGIVFQAASQADILITNSDSGTVTGIKTAHTQDILVLSTAYPQITLHNTKLASATEVGSQASLLEGSYIRSQKHDQTAGNHKTFLKYGTLTIDTTIFDASPSERLTPNNASGKLQSSSFFAAIDSGGTATVTVKVRESVSGDGTAYNGGRIRLIVKKNVAAGISANTVLATATSASNGAFETISGTTATVTDDAILEFFVDCDGTTGWTNVDTWVGPTAKSTLGEKYWKDGNFFAYADNSSGGGSAVGFRTKLRTVGT